MTIVNDTKLISIHQYYNKSQHGYPVFSPLLPNNLKIIQKIPLKSTMFKTEFNFQAKKNRKKKFDPENYFLLRYIFDDPTKINMAKLDDPKIASKKSEIKMNGPMGIEQPVKCAPVIGQATRATSRA